jgi:hypothetical protein
MGRSAARGALDAERITPADGSTMVKVNSRGLA